jgi:hypothetical protein
VNGVFCKKEKNSFPILSQSKENTANCPYFVQQMSTVFSLPGQNPACCGYDHLCYHLLPMKDVSPGKIIWSLEKEDRFGTPPPSTIKNKLSFMIDTTDKFELFFCSVPGLGWVF